jgi:hypothetical protein
MLTQLQTSSSGFLGNMLEGLIAFCIFVVIVFIGMSVAKFLGLVLRKFMNKLGVEKFLASHGVHDAFVGFSFTNIVVAVLKIYVVVAFIGIAADVVNVEMVTVLASQAIGYLPSLIQGLVILMLGLVAGDYITDRMKESKKIPFSNSVAIVVEVFIAYNALVIAMPLLLPAADPSLLIWSFLLVLAAFSIAIGFGSAIAIGLGLKDAVAAVAKKNKSKIESLI